jgi:hypothetical protein
LGGEIIDDIRDEERQSAGVIVQLVNQRFLDASVGQAALQVLCDFDLRERIEDDFFAEAMQAQLLPQLSERM